MNCRICKKSNLSRFLDLGFTPPADDFLSPQRLNSSEIYYPLEVFVCNDCGLIQLGYVVLPELLFQNEYPYESSTTLMGRTHYFNLAKDIVQRYKLKQGDLAIDIGSNVGVLLNGFRDNGIRVLGIEPAKDVCKIANDNSIETINEFFSDTLAMHLAESGKKAKVVTGTNVVAHIDDLHMLVKGLDILLEQKGVFVFEAPYLVHLLENLEYDTIYHEHLSYMSVKPMQYLFNKYGMEIIDLEEKSIHGGTLRYHVSRIGDFEVSPNVKNYIDTEIAKGIYNLDYLEKFSQKVINHRNKLSWMLSDLKRQGKKIVGVSAPAKGMTLLNYCKLGTETLDFLTEKARLKIGKFAPGTHIPVVPDSELLTKMPDYALLLAWNFADEIMKNNSEYRERGGKFIIPIPEPKIV
ncbi:MAG: methyltransferase [Ignavibacteria bacterium GWB2_35_6b]|nr:MAG: methyltransferase [Ignavibacteria bacterium GWB2_35_6b]